MKDEKSMKDDLMGQLTDACEAAGIPLRGTGFLCRTLAILYCYGGGPGGERFRRQPARAAVMMAGKMLEKAALDGDPGPIAMVRGHIRELQANRAPWLENTLFKLDIPAREIKFGECAQPKSPPGC